MIFILYFGLVDLQQEYASEIANKLSMMGIFADVDNSDYTLPKKIRNGEVSQYNFILVMGEKEQEARSVDVRNRGDVGQKSRSAEITPLDTICEQFLDLTRSRRSQTSSARILRLEFVLDPLLNRKANVQNEPCWPRTSLIQNRR